MTLKFRARLKKADGTPWLFYQADQYPMSFLRRVTSWMAWGEDDEDKARHESYLEQTVFDVLDQWTGLVDRNGKEIYGGDIIKIPSRYNGDHHYDKETSVIEWHYDGWYTPMRGDECHYKETEVIGDVWTTPELKP